MRNLLQEFNLHNCEGMREAEIQDRLEMGAGPSAALPGRGTETSTHPALDTGPPRAREGAAEHFSLCGLAAGVGGEGLAAQRGRLCPRLHPLPISDQLGPPGWRPLLPHPPDLTPVSPRLKSSLEPRGAGSSGKHSFATATSHSHHTSTYHLKHPCFTTSLKLPGPSTNPHPKHPLEQPPRHAGF